MLEKIIHKTIQYVIYILAAVLLAVLVYTVVEFIQIIVVSIYKHPINLSFNKNDLFINIVSQLISAVLLILIIIEILELVIHYNILSKAKYLTLVIEVAIISIVRHLIAIDLDHVNASELFGIAIIILTLSAFYLFLVLYKKKLE